MSNAEEVHQSWLAAMRAGDFEAAWRQTDRIEKRRRSRNSQWHQSGELRWDGTPFTGRRVLIRCLHGLGDTLQFVRFVPRVWQVAAHVTLAIQPQLLSLFEPNGEFGSVENGWTANPFAGHDVEVEIMELAYAFRATADTLPARVPYLDTGLIQFRSNFVCPPMPAKLRVGILWKSSGWDPERSMPPRLLSALRDVDAAYYSLQQDVTAEELRCVPFPVFSLSRDTRTIVDAARAMLWLDLIITVDGMSAHLAGALGRPVWVLLKHQADWRWMDGRADSPWYPTMRLFRQPRPGDWESVIRHLRGALQDYRPAISSASSCFSPESG